MEILPQLIANSLIAAATYALVALGFNLIYSTTKFFNLAHGAIAVAGGYAVVALLIFFPGASLFICIMAGVIGAGFLGWSLDRIVYRPLRRRRASSLVMLVASLGAFTVIQALIAIFFTSQFQSLARIAPTAVYEVSGASLTTVQVMILLGAILVMIGLIFFLHFTLWGKAIRAVSDDEEVAKIVGINTEKVIGTVMFIGSAIAGLSGVFIGLDTGLLPTIGLTVLLRGVIASIIGGIGSVYGSVVGALLMGFVENFGIWKISGEWKDAIAFGLLILFLIFRPEGIIKK